MFKVGNKTKAEWVNVNKPKMISEPGSKPRCSSYCIMSFKNVWKSQLGNVTKFRLKRIQTNYLTSISPEITRKPTVF